jgi:hypothetical protein
MKAKIQNAKYKFEHGHSPRGYGSWAFHPDFNVNASSPEIMWVHQSLYSDAKLKAAVHFGALGKFCVETLP